MELLENLLQSRKNLEVKKINAEIADNNPDEIEEDILKFDMIKSSLEFQMNEILKDVEDNKYHKLYQ